MRRTILLIKNGRVVDGSGAPAFHADVAVQGGKIVGVGKANGAAAKRTIDAQGRVRRAGLYRSPPACRSASGVGPLLRLIGAERAYDDRRRPMRPGHRAGAARRRRVVSRILLRCRADPAAGAEGWGRRDSWGIGCRLHLDAMAKRRGCNVGALIGHSGIRRYVMGEAASERVQATPDEMAAMKKLDLQRLHVRRRARAFPRRQRIAATLPVSAMMRSAGRSAACSASSAPASSRLPAARPAAPRRPARSRDNWRRAPEGHRSTTSCRSRSPTPRNGRSICNGVRTRSKPGPAATARAPRSWQERFSICCTGSMSRRTRTSPIRTGCSAACRPGTRSWLCPPRIA